MPAFRASPLGIINRVARQNHDSPYIPRHLALPQRDELCVTQVILARPFHELKLSHQHRIQPPTIRHLRRRQPSTPTSGFLLWQVREWTIDDFELLKPLHQIRPERGRETISRAGG